jgi:hypothetical protein
MLHSVQHDKIFPLALAMQPQVLGRPNFYKNCHFDRAREGRERDVRKRNLLLSYRAAIANR